MKDRTGGTIVDGRDSVVTTKELADLFADDKEMKTFRVCPNWSEFKETLTSSGSVEHVKRKKKKSSKSRAMLTRLHANLVCCVLCAFYDLIFPAALFLDWDDGV